MFRPCCGALSLVVALAVTPALADTDANGEPLPIGVSGYVHVDWVPYRQSSRDDVTSAANPQNEDRFTLRRARLHAERDHGLFHGIFELDANTTSGPQVRPINAEASIKWPADRTYARTPLAYDVSGTVRPLSGTSPLEIHRAPQRPGEPWFMVTGGLFRTPFGFEVMESERERPWLERTTAANALVPQSFDLGLRVLGGFSFVRYQLGIMNGDPIGERTFPGRDPNESKDLVFRVGAATMFGRNVEVEGGLSGLTGRGFHPGQAATKDTLQFKDSNGNGVVDSTKELQVVPGTPAQASADLARSAFGADVRANFKLPVVGDLHVRGEIFRAHDLDRGLYVSDPIVAGHTQRQRGWYVGVAQELTHWALVGVRYDAYDPDVDATGVGRVRTMSTWSFSATARTRVARLVAELDLRSNAFALDKAGHPTIIADDTFTLRAEVRF